MNILKNSYPVMATILVGSFLQADFTDVNVWQRAAASGTMQQFITCGDRHSVKKVGLQQAQEIVALLAPGKDNAIIIEDAYDYTKSIEQLAALQDGTENHQYLMGDFQHFQTQTLNATRRQSVVGHALSGIVLVPELAAEQGVACESVEFRQFVTFQLPSLLELIDEYGYDHRAVIKQLVDRVCAEVASFNDSPELNAFYKETLDKFIPIKSALDAFIVNAKEPIAKFPSYMCDLVMADPASFDLESLTYASPYPYLVADKKKTSALQQALREDKNLVDRNMLQERIETDFIFYAFSPLIDAYILHALHEKQCAATGGNTVVLCAGLAHNMSIEQFLPQLGYEQVAAFQNNEGVAIADALQDILNSVQEQGSNQFVDVIVAMVDGVKTAFDTVTSFFGLA